MFIIVTSVTVRSLGCSESNPESNCFVFRRIARNYLTSQRDFCQLSRHPQPVQQCFAVSEVWNGSGWLASTKSAFRVATSGDACSDACICTCSRGAFTLATCTTAKSACLRRCLCLVRHDVILGIPCVVEFRGQPHRRLLLYYILYRTEGDT